MPLKRTCLDPAPARQDGPRSSLIPTAGAVAKAHPPQGQGPAPATPLQRHSAALAARGLRGQSLLLARPGALA